MEPKPKRLPVEEIIIEMLMYYPIINVISILEESLNTKMNLNNKLTVWSNSNQELLNPTFRDALIMLKKSFTKQDPGFAIKINRTDNIDTRLNIIKYILEKEWESNEDNFKNYLVVLKLIS